MNPDDLHEISEVFAWEPVLPMLSLTLLCAALAVALAVLFWIDRRRATRPAMVPLLFLFRLLAVGGVWLALANPTAVRTTHTTSPKHTAIFVDTSASMGLQDSAKTSGNTPRWQRSAANDSTATVDETLALLGAAGVNLSRAALTTGAEENRAALTRAGDAAHAAFERLERARKLPGAGPRLAPLRGQLEAEILRPLDRILRDAAPAAEAHESTHAPLHALTVRATELREQLRPIADAVAFPMDTNNPPRIEQTRRWLASGEQGWLGELGRTTALSRCQFSKAVAPVGGAWAALKSEDAANPDAGTNLQTALDDLARRATDGRLDFAMLVTDGVHNATETPLHLPEPLAGVPLLVVPVGDFEPRRDIALRWKEAPKTVLLKDQLTVQARVSASLCDGDDTVIELVEGKRVLDSKPLHFTGKSADRLVELKWTPERAGSFDLTLRVRPVAREMSLSNNDAPLKVNVVDQRIDLLIADSGPRWETRYLFNLFRREAHSQMTSLLFDPLHAYPGRQMPPTPALPFALDAWQRFQVVILGDLSAQQLTKQHQELLKKYVEGGGALIVIAGAESMPAAFAGGPLAELLPVLDGGPVGAGGAFGVRLTEEGKTAEALRISGADAESDALRWATIFEALPIYDLSPWSKAKPSARVLIEAVPLYGKPGPARVFLATQSYGRGSVSYFSSPSTYALRWRFGDLYHYQFWGQFVRALVANQFGSGSALVRMQTDKFSYREGEPVRARLRLRSRSGEPVTGAGAEIVAGQAGEVRARATMQPDTEVPGEYVAALTGLHAGKFELWADGENVAALLRSVNAESTRIQIEIEAAGPTEEMLAANAAPPFFEQVQGLPNVLVLAPAAVPLTMKYFDFTPRRSEVVQRTPLWNRWQLLLAIVACLALEWSGRKFAGLI